MHYLILNYIPPSDYADADADAVAAAAEGAVWGAYTSALIEAGVFVGGNALHPSHTATTLRVRGEGRDIQDGPRVASRRNIPEGVLVASSEMFPSAYWIASSGSAVHLHTLGPIAVEIGQDDKRHRASERGIPPPHQEPYRAALRRNRADATLGADSIGPNPDAKGRWLGNLGSAHRPDQP